MKAQVTFCLKDWYYRAGLAIMMAGSVQSETLSSNLLSNAGFENVEAGGKPLVWNVRPPFVVTNENPHSGKNCLRFENHDAAKYVLCAAPVTLKVGHRYEFSAWIRARDVQGKDSGATFCVEWNDTKGKWMGGIYAEGVKNTKMEWHKVKAISGPMPEGATGFHLSCYLRKGMTGTAWWDDLEVREYFPPLVEGITSDCYRNITDGQTITVKAGLNLEAYRMDVTRVAAHVVIKDVNGKTVAAQPSLTVASNEVQCVLNTTSFPAGKYEIILNVSTVDGQGRGSASLKFQRVERLPTRKAWINSSQQLVLDGQPFFPLGTYWSGVNARDLDLYAQSAFNCIMPYAALSRADLDAAHTRNIKVIYSVKDLYYGTKWTPKNISSRADERNVLESKIKSLADHPAILAWYINDELPVTMLDQLTDHRDWLEELDPQRPTWVVLYQVDQIRGYLPSFDVIGADPYPIPNQPPSLAMEWTRKTRRATFNSRAVWMVPQIFNWAAYRHTPEEKNKCRPPTLAEMRSMAWQCIAEGANGLIFYSWFDLQKMDKATRDGSSGLAPEPFDRRWAEVCQMAAEIKKFTPILLSGSPACPVQKWQAPATVSWRTFGNDQDTWLLVVNGANQPAAASFQFSKSLGRVTVENAAQAPQSDGRSLTVTLSPLEVSLLKVGF